MLILTRRISESLLIYENGKENENDIIKIIALGVKGNQVRIGIEASKKWAIHREEIYEKILEEIKIRK